MRGCNQSGAAAAPHARPATTVHASVRVDRRCIGHPTCGQEKPVRDRSVGFGEVSLVGDFGEGSLGKDVPGERSLGEVMRHRHMGGVRHRVMMNVGMSLQAVGLVGMGAGQGRRELNGDQDDHRTNKLPKLWVRVHQAHNITGLSALHRSD